MEDRLTVSASYWGACPPVQVPRGAGDVETVEPDPSVDDGQGAERRVAAVQAGRRSIR